MECRIEYENHRHFRHYFFACFHTCDVCRIVNRSQFCICFASCQHFVCYEYRRCEIFTAVYHSVADCTDFTEIFHTADFRICDRRDDLFNSRSVIRQGYESAGFDMEVLDNAIDHAFELAQEQEQQRSESSRQPLPGMGGWGCPK